MDQAVITRECAGENDTGVVSEFIGQTPSIRQLGAQCRCLVSHHQRYAGVPKRIEAGTDSEPRRVVEGLVPRRLNCELFHDVDRGPSPRQLDHFGWIVDRFEARSPRLALHQPCDVHVGHAVTCFLGQSCDELLTGQDPPDIDIVEDLLHAGQAQGRARDHYRLAVRSGPVLACGDCCRLRW